VHLLSKKATPIYIRKTFIHIFNSDATQILSTWYGYILYIILNSIFFSDFSEGESFHMIAVNFYDILMILLFIFFERFIIYSLLVSLNLTSCQHAQGGNGVLLNSTKNSLSLVSVAMFYCKTQSQGRKIGSNKKSNREKKINRRIIKIS